ESENQESRPLRPNETRVLSDDIREEWTVRTALEKLGVPEHPDHLWSDSQGCVGREVSQGWAPSGSGCSPRTMTCNDWLEQTASSNGRLSRFAARKAEPFQLTLANGDFHPHGTNKLDSIRGTNGNGPWAVPLRGRHRPLKELRNRACKIR